MLVEEVYTKTRQRHFELHGTGPGRRERHEHSSMHKGRGWKVRGEEVKVALVVGCFQWAS